jgi:hypothetical protein
MDACLARLFHPAMEGGRLAPAQDRAKTENQLAHDSEARALPLQDVDDLRLLAGQLGAYLAQQCRRHLRRQLSGPRRDYWFNLRCVGEPGDRPSGLCLCLAPRRKEFCQSRVATLVAELPNLRQ